MSRTLQWGAEFYDDNHRHRRWWSWRLYRKFWTREDARSFVRAMNHPSTQVFRYRVVRLRAGGGGGK